MYSINKIFFALFCVLFFALSANANIQNELDDLIDSSSVSSQSIVSVSVREAVTGKNVYKSNDELLLHTASTLKAFTSAAAFSALGENYAFKTALYKDKGDIYLKLSGDPLLTYADLGMLFSKVDMAGIKRVFIDDSALDDIPWGVGWMWDDYDNYHMPRFNAYNLDDNVVEINIIPQKSGQKPKVSHNSHLKIINAAVSSSKNSPIIELKPWIDDSSLFIKGYFAKAKKVKIPVQNPRAYFLYKLNKIVKNNAQIKTAKVPFDAVLLNEVSHGIKDVMQKVNCYSNNMAAEILFKTAGGEKFGEPGSTKKAIEMFNAFYSSIGADTGKIRIYDGSGASHNDLVTTQWMSEALYRLKSADFFDGYLKTLACPGKGTLANRLKFAGSNLKAKTGTLAGISGITGYLKSKSGKSYTFAILVQNYNGSSAKAKELEDEIIHIIYTRF